MIIETNVNQTELKDFIKNRDLVSIRVRNYIGALSKQEISDLLQISRPTLNRRLKEHSWRLGEIKTIIQNMPY